MLIPFHAHNRFGSVGDATLGIPEYLDRAKEYGLPAVAITDHGSLAAMYRFHKEAKKRGIKPIIGCEVYFVDDRTHKEGKKGEYNHLILIAIDNNGLNNLIQIVNDAHLTGFYYVPRTDMTVLEKYGAGIVAMSACVGGSIPQLLYNGLTAQADKLAMKFKSVFDEFYLEIQPGTFEMQREVNDKLVEMAKRTGLPLIVTNDIHYLDQEDAVLHDFHVKIERKGKADDPMVYPDTCYWFMNHEDIKSAFVYSEILTAEIVEETIANTVALAVRCNTSLDEEVHMPVFPITERTEEQELNRLCFNKLEEIEDSLEDPAHYVERLMYELDTIKQLGFPGYFLIVRDFLEYARSQDYPVGPGRGSVGGASVANLLDICVADPIKHNLLFERFLSPHRKSIPDIDMDFDSSCRDMMFQYAINKYGRENCALVSTFHMRKAKSAIRDVARVMGIDLKVADKIAKLIPETHYDDDGEKAQEITIADSLKWTPELRSYQEKFPELFEVAMKLEKIPSGSGVHAAGLIISPIPLIDRLPLVRSNKEGILATALNLEDAELAGFVKFDFLALSSLSVYDKSQKDMDIIFEHRGNAYDDPAVWNLIGSQYTTGIFQLGSRTYKQRMPRLRPHSIDELAACLALVRGPCISSKADETYMNIIEGKRDVELIHPLYDNVTRDTNGILIYQEQIMQIAVAFGMTLEDGYKLVKLVAKKKVKELAEFKTKFATAAKTRGAAAEVIDRVWTIINDAGLYAFNSSHATSYAILSYESAYLKYYYPESFLRNVITNAYLRDKDEELACAVDDCRRLQIPFLPLDINKSDWEFILQDDGIRLGMCAIKSFGINAWEEIKAKRPFETFDDFVERVEKSKCNKRAVLVGIYSGLFDCFGNRRQLHERYFELRKEKEFPTEISLGKESFLIDDAPAIIEEKLLTVQLMTDPSHALAPIDLTTIAEKEEFEAEVYLQKIEHKKTKYGKMAFINLLTSGGAIKCRVYDNVLEKVKGKLAPHTIRLIRAKKKSFDECVLKEIS